MKILEIITICLFSLFSILPAVIPWRSPSILRISSYQLKDVGSDVELECLIENAKEFMVRWMKIEKGQPVILSEKLKTKDRRFVIKYENFSNKHTTIEKYALQINNFQNSDEGIYRCVLVLSSNNHLMDQVKLQAKKYLHMNIFPSEVYAQLGQNITIKCNATGEPEPTISWTREGSRSFPDGKIIQRSHTLTISDVMDYDKGMYFCHADNAVDPPNSRNVTVKLVYPPVVTTPYANMNRKINTTVELECQIKSFPISKVIWEKNSKELLKGGPYSFSFATSHADDSLISKITFSITQKDDFGIYSCIATNHVGENGREIFLQETLKDDN